MKKIPALCLFLLPLAGLAQNLTRITECVIENGQLKSIAAEYNPATGDKTVMVNGTRKKLDDVYPPKGKDYAEGKTWYINNEQLNFSSKPYKKYGLPRILGSNEVERSGLNDGVGIYVEAGVKGLIEVIYIPVRRGCEFQPYQLDCQRVYIEEDPKFTTGSMDLFAKVEGEAGKINYAWQSPDLPILKGQGTNRISVDTRSKQAEEEFGMILFASAGKKCWSASSFFVVKKPTAAAAAKWSKKDRDDFIAECIPNTKMEKTKGTVYCNCMLDKLMKLYPTPDDAQKNLKQDKLMELAKECLQQ